MTEPRQHHYAATTIWRNAAPDAAFTYETYSRAYRIEIDGKPPIEGSSDATFHGDPGRHNPEDLLVAALSACHMLWYLHLCSVKDVTVLAYEDPAEGVMVEAPRDGRFTEVTLRPRVTITADSDPARAEALHERAHAECFIANSVNFPVHCEPTIVVAEHESVGR
jgi:organic hydroperoxide reductase OsmC/OhrA